MSKAQFEEDDLPPSYMAAVAPAHHDSTTSRSIADSLTSPLTSHLHTLPGRMRQAQQARSTQQAVFDLELITLLVPHVEAFLSDLGSMPRAPPLAELTLVPSSTCPRDWILSGAAERRREGEVVRLVRVEHEGGSKEDQGSAAVLNTAPTSRTYDDDGMDGGRPDSAGTWWWQDERMAHRLAAHLQPKPEPNLNRQQVHAVVEKEKEAKRTWGWGRKSSTEKNVTGASPTSPTGSSSSQGTPPARSNQPPSSRVSMSARAEEVTFRKENDFGIWESKSGYGIVVRVKIRSG